ncbi:MAG: peptidase [Yoonia sp.]|uniref:peptidase n=1 Tax=Yoonia sp. TaxID=2212373 RepID=UPI0032658721
MTLMSFAAYEQPMKWVAFVLGFCSTICVVQGWHLGAMLFSLPFCLIWIYCGWLRTEPQLKWINVMFAVLYVYGIGRYVLLA